MPFFFIFSAFYPGNGSAAAGSAQNDLSVFIGIHRQASACGQLAVDQHLCCGVLHRLADGTAQVTGAEFATLGSAPPAL